MTGSHVESDTTEQLNWLTDWLMVVLFLIFWGTSSVFPWWLYQFTFPKPIHKDSLFFTSSLILVISCLFNNSHFYRLWWYLTVVLACIFPWLLMILRLFWYTCWTPVCFLWENVCSGPLLVLKSDCLFSLLLSCMDCILDISSLLHIWFTAIFSHLVSCLFILFVVSFAVYKVFIFAFVAFVFGVRFK